ncbi:uncharacterized protein TNIN_260221 [Trichonephila inaurata madagascariensis]|uniref:Uncharacterized protein n=1 Tax=Trichonephila inaurata madagascariensis TaxID=2747483 RepID=A0A8X6X6N3_9ARAC|nr:uncharacterized protein TNIN_260221 [Trichonephila inaurata madagascariensis]
MKRSTPPSSKFAKSDLKRNVEKKDTSYAFGTSLFSMKQKLPESLGPGWYETQILNVGRKVSYTQTFGGAPVIRHKKYENECDFVKNLSPRDVKKMNAKADYLRLYEKKETS